MQFDKKAVDKLLSLSDAQLNAIIQRAIKDAGIDLSEFGASQNDIQSIRRALGSITESDISRLSEQYNARKKRGGK